MPFHLQNVCLLILTASLLAFGSFSPVHASSDVAQNLMRIEARGLKGVTEDRLKKILSVTPHVLHDGGVVFTRAWLEKQPKPSGGPEFRCLSEALYFEARGETVKGLFAVAEVIRNRVKSKRFPNSYCGVINQGTGKKFRCQFSYTCDGIPEKVSEPRAYARVAKVARAAMDGLASPLTDGATFYHTTAVRPSWARVFSRTAHIGDHYFYRRGKRLASN